MGNKKKKKNNKKNITSKKTNTKTSTSKKTNTKNTNNKSNNNDNNKLIKRLKDNSLLIYIIITLSLIRLLFSMNLPTFVIANLPYDDMLMLKRLVFLTSGKYFGAYNQLTLVKGVVYPLFIYLCHTIKISYSMGLTLLYMGGCLYFTLAFKNVVKNKYLLLIIYAVLLFNPISYSSDLFQRLYRNSLSIIEILFFLGVVIRIIYSEKENIFNYIFLGIIASIMFLTKEDNIWIWLVLIVLFIYKVYNKRNIKNVLINIIPVLLIALNLNIVSCINYHYYKTYTYNELNKSEFKKAYIKILQIKEDKKIDRVSIQKETLYKLAKESKTFNVNRENIDIIYSKAADKNGEINNGNMMWYLKGFTNLYGNFKNGKEANIYYKKLGKEIDKLFEEGKLEKEFTVPSLFINTPTWKDIKKLPKNFVKAVAFTSGYDEIKVMTKENYSAWKYDDINNVYLLECKDYHNSANIVKASPLGYGLVKILYGLLTIVLSIPCLYIYFKNIRKRDKINLILGIVVLIYLLIMGGVVYTHVTAYDAIRYCYLGNIYLLQSIFIMLNLYRCYIEKDNNNDIEKRN